MLVVSEAPLQNFLPIGVLKMQPYHHDIFESADEHESTGMSEDFWIKTFAMKNKGVPKDSTVAGQIHVFWCSHGYGMSRVTVAGAPVNAAFAGLDPTDAAHRVWAITRRQQNLNSNLCV